MCERYVVPDQALAERELGPEQRWWRFSASFNVAPTRFVPAVRMFEGRSEAVMMRWGLIPAWAKGDLSAGQWLRLASADIERSPLHHGPWLDGQRCLLPFAGFYTWRRTPGGYRQPHYVWAADRPVFAVAGLWDCTENDDGDAVEGCALLTVPANGLLERIQTATREMPAILSPADYRTWLHGTPDQARALLRTPSAESLSSHPVSPRVNSMACDDPSLVRAVG
jgi:putative SOS response-associated peptidase YedK